MNLFIQIILIFLTNLFAIINQHLPQYGTTTQDLIESIDLILGIGEQALNFIYFIVGDSLLIMLPLIVSILTYKYLFYPLVDFVRRCIPFVNL